MRSVGNLMWESPYGLDVPLSDAEGITLFDINGYAETVIAFQSGVRAVRVGTFTGQPADNDTFTCARVDGSSTVYRWKTTPAAVNDVLIGADQDASLTNLSYAITGGGTAGTNYFLGTEPCLDWDVAIDTGANTITLTAINYGDAYDVAVAAIAESTANFTLAAATLGVNSVDFLQYHNNSGTVITAADAVEAQPFVRAGEVKVAPIAAQLTAKRFTGVIYDDDQDSTGDDTATSVFLRRQFTVITTHHPAAGDPKGVLYCGVLDDPTDLTADGLYVEIPNLSHADDGDWLGGEYSVPDVDNIIANCIVELWNPYTGVGLGWFAEVKSYDFTDAGFGTNQGRAVFVVGGGLPATICATLRAGSKVYYRVYGSNIGRVAELATQAKADVNTEVVDALNVDTYAEPVQGAPGATITLAAKINYLYKAFRNRKTQTATVWSLFNDDATTVDHKATVADDGVTASKTEVATGP